MLQRFLDYANEQHLFPAGETVLLAVSGGRDSVCLAHLMHRAGIPFAIAHCNFHLRPGDCDRDQAFVARLAASYGVPFHTTDFDTRAYAAAHGQSLEEAARELRYNWFASILNSLSPASLSPHILATAHHRDDSIETFFLNLFRGTGIAGLHGIRPSTKAFTQSRNHAITIVRPLLLFSRAEIDSYVVENGLEYVEDYTNSLLAARRNQIRLRLMPLLRELYPSVDDTMAANMERLHDTEVIYKKYIDDVRARVVKPYRSQVPDLPVEILSVDLAQLAAEGESSATLLFELLHPYGFNGATVADISRLAFAGASTPFPTGRLFYTPSYVAELHRGLLLLAPLDNSSPEFPPSSLSPLDITSPSPLEGGQGGVSILRPWHPGDRFRPKGMHGTRLVSDFLKDLHLSRIEKQYVLVRVDANDRILSVVGLRDAEV
ncbi:MAG: tRNA lysidine(34) synthetase TilS [Bacteroidales bacterium]|nr:tRNA lysidine(34) synthetase TilS [Bacteroidales bacterium]